jgi:hypothetical protein
MSMTTHDRRLAGGNCLHAQVVAGGEPLPAAPLLLDTTCRRRREGTHTAGAKHANGRR